MILVGDFPTPKDPVLCEFMINPNVEAASGARASRSGWLAAVTLIEVVGEVRRRAGRWTCFNRIAGFDTVEVEENALKGILSQ
jgi:hypothetical protein